MTALDPYLPAAGDGVDAEAAGAIADGEAWCLRLEGGDATAGRVRVERTGDGVIVTVIVDGETTSVEASAELDADGAEGLAATLLDAVRTLDGGGGE